jgi:hypothetical protein
MFRTSDELESRAFTSAVAEHLQLLSFPARETIVYRGELQQKMYVVQKGLCSTRGMLYRPGKSVFYCLSFCRIFPFTLFVCGAGQASLLCRLSFCLVFPFTLFACCLGQASLLLFFFLCLAALVVTFPLESFALFANSFLLILFFS